MKVVLARWRVGATAGGEQFASNLCCREELVS